MGYQLECEILLKANCSMRAEMKRLKAEVKKLESALASCVEGRLLSDREHSRLRHTASKQAVRIDELESEREGSR